MRTFWLCCLGWAGCFSLLGLHAQDSPPAVVYEVFVQSFADSDGDGIGDLRGLTQRLDYIAELGVEAIWMMPIHPTPSYHKYDVVDYRAIHPDYGTMEDFDALVRRAHELGLQVILDLVINHSSDQHRWFRAAKADPASPYRDYYVWADYDSIAAQVEKQHTTLDSDNLTQWHQVPGQAEHYYGFFWGGMPDLNWDHEPLQQAVYDIGHFWLAKGVDGFRLDAAHHIFPYDRLEANHRMWRAFRQAMQEVDPEVYLVGEVYATPDIVTPYLAGLPAVFNFGLAERIIVALQSEHDSGLVAQHMAIRRAYQAANPAFIDATILSNHDQNRIASVLDHHPQKLRLAASLLYTLPGTPYLYYGEELGMRGQKPDERIREPFPWDQPGRDPLQTSWLKVQHNGPEQVAPLSVQRNDSTALYHHYRRLIRQRKALPALRSGALAPTTWQQDGLVSFYRITDEQRLLVIHNLSDRPLSYPSDQTSAQLRMGSGSPGQIGAFESQVWELSGK